MSALSAYLSQVQRLLHDARAQFWSVAELTDYINEGRKQIVGDTGCYRRLQTGYLSPGVETYAFGGVTGFNVTAGGTGYASVPTVTLTGGGGSGATATATLTSGVVTSISVTATGSGYTSAPTVSFGGGGGSGAAALSSILHANTIDCVNATYFWGTTRRVLPFLPWSKYNAYARYWQTNPGPPGAAAVYSATIIYMQQVPDQAYAIEWDTVVLPPELVDDTTVEVIPQVFQPPVQYFAAYKAKVKEQSWGEAEQFMKQYVQFASTALRQSFTRRSPNPYG
jgi:hypothetical protein